MPVDAAGDTSKDAIRKKKKEALELVRQLERRIEVQESKKRSAENFAKHHEDVLQRKKEVKELSERSQLLIEARRLEDRRRKAMHRELERQERAKSRESMYSLFHSKHDQTRHLAEGWNSSLNSSKMETLAYDLWKKEQILREKEERSVARNRAIDAVKESRKAAHEARLEEQRRCAKMIEARGIERSRYAQQLVAQTHESIEAARRARQELELKKQQERENLVQAQQAAEERELHELTRRLAELKVMESRLHSR